MEGTEFYSIARQSFLSPLPRLEFLCSVSERYNPFSTIKIWQFSNNPPQEFYQLSSVPTPRCSPATPGWRFGCAFALPPFLT